MTLLPVSMPEGFIPLVEVGKRVSVGDILAHKLSSPEEILNIPSALNISLDKVKHVLKKNPGDRVEVGDTIALKKNFFGKQTGVITSQISGTVSRYERDTGNLVMKVDEQLASQELVSPVEGKINLCNNKEILIETDHAVAGGSLVSGTKAEGELFILEESFTEDGIGNVLFYLDSRAIGKIVLGGNFSREVLIKGVGIGTAGFIGTTIKADDINYLQEKNISLPVLEINEEALSKLRKWNGKKVAVDAQTKVIILI